MDVNLIECYPFVVMISGEPGHSYYNIKLIQQ